MTLTAFRDMDSIFQYIVLKHLMKRSVIKAISVNADSSESFFWILSCLIISCVHYIIRALIIKFLKILYYHII